MKVFELYINNELFGYYYNEQECLMARFELMIDGIDCLVITKEDTEKLNVA